MLIRSLLVDYANVQIDTAPLASRAAKSSWPVETIHVINAIGTDVINTEIGSVYVHTSVAGEWTLLQNRVTTSYFFSQSALSYFPAGTQLG